MEKAAAPSPQADPSTPGEETVAIPGDDILATPDDNDVAKEPHWACPGKLAWLDIGMIGPSSIIRQRLTSQERVDGFENHPVLIWRAPDEDGIVQVIPITSYGGQRAEQKWGKMREGPMKQAKLQQLLMLENGWERPHCGTEVLPFTKPFSCRKRSYLHIEHGIFNLEAACLTPYTVRNDSDIVLADSAMHYISMQMYRYVHPCLWMGEEDAVVQVPTAFSAKDLTKLWRCS
ncbi:hypothetical protein SLS58_006303 [Diplodia intermedia]|uniref:Uncharacterized protein n=1 Tax=Diplodia intermedia TaxID=856260 RepID=A0ABR3TNJ2_9PEZI